MAIVASASVKVTPDLTGFRRDLAAQLSAIKSKFEVTVTANVEKARAEIDKFVARESGKDIEKKIKISKSSLQEAQSAISGLGVKGNLIALAVPVAFTALISAAQALGPLLVQASAAALLIPGAIAAAGVTMIAFKASLDAIKPQLKQLKTQFDNLFKPTLIPAVNNLKNLIVALTPGLRSVSSALGGAAFGFTKWLGSASGTAQLNQLLRLTSTFIGNIGRGLAPLGSAFLTVSNIGITFLNSFTAGFGKAATNLSNFVASAAGTAKIKSLIQGSINALKTLGQIAQQIGGIVTNVFSGLSLGAGNLGQSFLPVLKKINAGLGSIQGQQALASIGAALAALSQVITSTIGPAFAKILPVIVTFFNFVATHANTFGPLLVGFLVLGPIVGKVVGVLGTLLPVLETVFTVIKANPILLLVGALVAALAASGQLQPLLALIGQTFKQLAAVVGPVIGQVFNALITALTPVVSQLLPVLSQLLQAVVPVIGQLATAIGGALITVITQLAPPLLQIVQALLPPLLQVIVALLPAITQMATLFSQVVTVLAPVIGLVAGVIATMIAFQTKALTPIIGVLAKVISAFVGFQTGVIKGTADGIRGLISFFKGLGSAIGNLASSVGGFFVSIGSKIATAFPAVVSFFRDLPAKIGTFLLGLPLVLFNAFITAFKFAVPAIGQGIQWVLAELIALPFQVVAVMIQFGTVLVQGAVSAFVFLRNAVAIGVAAVLQFFFQLPGKIIAAITSLIGLIQAFMVSLWAFTTNAVSTGIEAVLTFFRALPGRVIGAVASLLGLLHTLMVNVWNSAKDAVTTGSNSIVTFVKGLPGKILGALGDFGGLLFRAGKAIIQGLIDGIKAAAGAVVGAVNGVLDKVRSLLPFSPAKTGPFSGKGWTLYSGRSIVEGLAQGIKERSSTAVDALNGVMTDLSGANAKFASGGLQTALSGAISSTVSAQAEFNPSPINVIVTGDEKGLRQFVNVEVQENNSQMARRVRTGLGTA